MKLFNWSFQVKSNLVYESIKLNFIKLAFLSKFNIIYVQMTHKDNSIKLKNWRQLHFFIVLLLFE